MLFNATYKDEQLTMKLVNTSSGSDDDLEIDVSALLGKITLKFTRTGWSINVSGEKNINNFIISGDLSFVGERVGS